MENYLSIIIPVYNEEETVIEILGQVLSVQLCGGLQKEILIVNDCSTDSTEAVITGFIQRNPEVKIKYFKHEINKGKGAALHTGINAASGTFTIIQDADLEYDPMEYNDLLRPLVANRADVVYGSRFVGHKPHRVLFYWHSVWNKFLTRLSNVFSNINLTDMETCYKAFRTNMLQSLILREKRFGFEPEVTAKIARIPHIRIFEVGISYYGRSYKEGKKIGWKDGFRAIWCILKYGMFKAK